MAMVVMMMIIMIVVMMVVMTVVMMIVVMMMIVAMVMTVVMVVTTDHPRESDSADGPRHASDSLGGRWSLVVVVMVMGTAVAP